jgi:hypothetical protein
MPFLYRTPVIVSRKQPYIDWANGLRRTDDEPDFPPELAQKKDIYLGRYYATEEASEGLLDEIWPDIFEEELFGWSTDESEWPANRTREMFDAWFETELADSIVDLFPDHLLTEDDVEISDAADAMSECAWCGAELFEEQGRTVGFALPNRDRFDHREGRVLSLLAGRDRVVTGVVTFADSEEVKQGWDVIFRACSRHCEKRLLNVVPAALQDLERQTLP